MISSYHQAKCNDESKYNRWQIQIKVHKVPFIIHQICNPSTDYTNRNMCSFASKNLISLHILSHPFVLLSPWIPYQVNPFVCQISAECISSCRCKQPPWQPTCWCLLGYSDRPTSPPHVSAQGGENNTSGEADKWHCVHPLMGQEYISSRAQLWIYNFVLKTVWLSITIVLMNLLKELSCFFLTELRVCM